jgi:hypothetical protein
MLDQYCTLLQVASVLSKPVFRQKRTAGDNVMLSGLLKSNPRHRRAAGWTQISCPLIAWYTGTC